MTRPSDPEAAPASGPVGRQLRRLVSTALAAFVALPALVGLAVAPATAGPGTVPAGTVTATGDPLAVTVQITEVSPTVLTPGEDLTVRATIRNDGDTTIEQPRASVLLNRVRPTTRAELQAWTDLEPTAAAGRRAAQAALPEPLEPGASTTVEVQVPADAIGLLPYEDSWGPRGLALEIGDGARRVGLQRTFLLWLTTDDVPQTRLSVLLPVTGPATTGTTPEEPDGATAQSPDDASDETTSDDEASGDQAAGAAATAELEELTGPQGRLANLLTVLRSDSGIGVAVDPALVEQAAAGGPHAQSWAAELTRTLPGRDTFALPWSDPDLAAAGHAGQPGLVGAAHDLSAGGSTAVLGVNARTDLLWAPASGTDKSTARLAAEVEAGTLVLGPDLLAPLAENVTAGSRATVTTEAGSLAALVPDATLDALLTDPANVETGATTATTVQRALAETAVVAREDTTTVRHLLLAPDRDWEPDVTATTAVLDALSAAPWLQQTPVSTLIGSSDTGTERAELPAAAAVEEELAPADVDTLAAARLDAQAFATVSDDPAALLAGLDQQLLAPLAVAWRADPAGRAQLVQSAVAEVQASMTGLSLAPLSNLNVISAHSDVRVTVRNDLAAPATVQVELRPAKACLASDGPVTVTVAAGTEETVTVAITATANCEVRVDAVLRAPGGHVVAPPVSFVARVSPTIEGVGTIVVGVLLAVGLVLGVVRTVRRGQSARRGARTEAEAIATGEVASVGVLGGGAPASGSTPAARPAPPEEKR